MWRNPSEGSLTGLARPRVGRGCDTLEQFARALCARLERGLPCGDTGPGGRFGYASLPHYWAQAERHFPFLIRHAGAVAGFALTTRGSPVSDDPDVMDVAEFFVLRRYRRSGVGRRAAEVLWHRFPGRWTVRVAAQNRNALAFWRGVVADAAGAPVSPTCQVTESTEWQIFAFEPRMTSRSAIGPG